MKSKDKIILEMIHFFITEMFENGISTIEEIRESFSHNEVKDFKNMIKEYKKMQSLTRSKAVKRVAEMKRCSQIKVIS